MTSVTASASNADRWSPTLVASRKLLAIHDGIVAPGCMRDQPIRGVFPTTKDTAIVSPSARPRPSIDAPTMPLRA